MDANFINIDSIGIGLSSYTDLNTLDLTNDEYLVVGQRANNTSNNLDTKYNFIVNNNGIAINSTRKEALNNNGLLCSSDITCKGKIITNSIELLGVTLASNITNDMLTKLINVASCNLTFFYGYSNNFTDINSDYISVDNIYTPSYLTIGAYSDTFSNLYPLNIVNTGNGTVENIQFCIQNDTYNNIEANKLRIGIIGSSSNAPSIITTTKDTPLEFHIGRDTSFINNLYSNGLGLPDYSKLGNLSPAMIINTDNRVGINTSIVDNIQFGSYYMNNKQIIRDYIDGFPNLRVDGITYTNKIIINDYVTNKPVNIDDIYLRNSGLTLKTNQIFGGDFNKDIFRFTSNLYIGKQGDNFYLNIYSHANINGNLIVNKESLLHNLTTTGISEFNDIATFNDDIMLNADLNVNNNLNLDGDFFIGGTRVNISNLDYANDNFNISDGSNIAIGGRLGVGILSTDSYNHQLTINKRNPNKFEILLQDFNTYSSDSSKVFIGHSENFTKGDDNSFVVFTQKSIKSHNIYFYAGKDLYNKSNIPNLSIMQNNMIGINTNRPQKTLDIIGDIISNDYFIKINNISYKTKQILVINNSCYIYDTNNLNININNINKYNNPKSLNIAGGINSYDGYYENTKKICNFKYYSDNNASTKNNISIGYYDKTNIPLSVRANNNNSIIRLYRGVIGGGIDNNATYSGIDICEYNTEIPSLNRDKFKWYIYKYHIDNHRYNQIGPLQIGYTYNTTNPVNSCINIYYNHSSSGGYHIDINNPDVSHNYNKNTAMSIYGNLEVKGDINIVGNFNFKNNGIIVGNLSNIISSIATDNINNVNTNNLIKNDISLIGNKILLLSEKTSVIGFKDDWILNNIDFISSYNTDTINNIPLYVYQNNYNIPTCKFYNKIYMMPNQPEISKIELGIINQNNNQGTIANKVDFVLKGYGDISILELTPFTPSSKPFITFYTNQTINHINIGTNNSCYDYNNGTLIYNESVLHINDNNKYLLHLTNENPPIINMHKIDNDSNYNWFIKAPDENNNFSICYENSNSNLFKILNDGSININEKNSIYQDGTFNINSIYNKQAVNIINRYDNNFLIDNNDIVTIDNSNLQYSILNEIDNNIIYNTLTYFTTYLPNKKISYYLNTSNIEINNSLNYTYNTTINNISVDYRFLNIDNIPPNIDDNNLNIIKNIKILPSLISEKYGITYQIDDNGSTVYINNNLNFTIDNYELYNIYNIPNSSLINLTYNSSCNVVIIDNSNIYNNVINTYLNITNNINEQPTENILLIDYYVINNNYIYTSNIIWYNPVPNIVLPIVNVSFNNNYIFNTILNIPISLLNYNNIYNTSNIDIDIDNNIIINSYTNFLNYQINNYDYTAFINQNYLVSTTNYNYLTELDINDSNQKITIDIPIVFNDYYSIYDFNNNILPIDLEIAFNNYLPHITLLNEINSNINNTHKIYSYDGNFKLCLDDKELILIDSNGSLLVENNITSKGDLIVKGNLIDKYGNPLIPKLNSDVYAINSSNFIINSSNIYFNGGISIIGSSIYNNTTDDDNFITLNSDNPSSYIHFASKYYDNNNVYRVGINNNTFGIWINKENSIIESGYVDGTPLSINNYSKALGITFDSNNNNFNYDINGYFNLLNDMQFKYNNKNIISIYTNNLNYQVHINSSLKVDGNILTPSDIRFKSNIVKIDNALDKLLSISGYTFTNNLINKKQTGLIAQELQKILPEAVEEDNNGFLNISYGNVIGLLIESIKDLKKELNLIKK